MSDPVVLPPRMEESIYTDGAYLQSHKDWHMKDAPWKAQQIERLLARNGLNPSTVGDVGCGAGEILRQLSLKTERTQYFGYEVSPQAFEFCRTRASDRLHFFLKNLLDEDVKYDCLICMDVFEHVADYLGFLRALRPKAEYKIFHIPLDLTVMSVLRGGLNQRRMADGHLHYFSQETAIATLKDCGYELIDGFLTAWFLDLPGGGLRLKTAQPLRKALFRISPRWQARLFGGCSYIALAK